MTTTPNAAAAGDKSWRTVIVLTLIYTYAFVDRVVLALLVEPIKADLGVSDIEMSLLLGLAFVAFYSVLNIPAGYLVDRISRRAIIGVSAVSWSLMTMACGLAQNFWQLFVGRAGVGLAEATIGPASFSLIREQVTPEQRSRAFSIFAAGPFLGGALSLIIGGALLAAAEAGVFSGVPWLASLKPWQAVLVTIGAAGIPIALLALLLPGKRIAAAKDATGDISYKAAIAHMRSNGTTYGLLIAYATLGGMLAFGKGAWIPAMIGRTWGWSPSDIGYLSGVLNLTCAPLGLLIGGMVMHSLAKAGRDIRLYGLAATALATVLMIAMPLAPTVTATWVLHGLGLAFSGVFYAVGATTLAEITPQRMMGKVTAAYLVLQGVISQASGPFIVAVVAETIFVAQGPRAIGYAMSLSGGVVGALSLVALVLLMRQLRKRSAHGGQEAEAMA